MESGLSDLLVFTYKFCIGRTQFSGLLFSLLSGGESLFLSWFPDTLTAHIPNSASNEEGTLYMEAVLIT